MARRKSKLGVIAFICVLITVILYCGTKAYTLIKDRLNLTENDVSVVDTLPEEPPEENITITIPAPEPEPEPEPEPLPWYLILVNRDNPLPQDYTIEPTHLSNGQDVDSRIYPALQQMFDDMRSQGVYPVVASGFRTWEKQQNIMDSRIEEYIASGMSEDVAKAEAEKWVALPGTSEHQLGICVDINADGVNSAGYEVYDWLKEHAHEYGFVQRYPEDKTEITGISNEPWHYRYVGIEDAKKMLELGLCLEEYIEYLQEQ